MNTATKNAKEDVERARKEFLHTCQHDDGFFCSIIVPQDAAEYPAVFLCGHSCGFWLTFDPDRYPNGVNYRSVSLARTKRVELVEGGKY